MKTPVNEEGERGMKARSNIYSRKKHVAALILCLLPALASCSDAATYEFWSCDKSKNEIYVLNVPKAYKPSGRGDSLLLTAKKRGPFTGESGTARPGEAGFTGTFFFSTYPEFDAIETATQKQKKATEAALVNMEIPSGSVEYGNKIQNILYGASHELNVKPERKGFRWREESLDGKYWVYPDPWLRHGGGGSDMTANFLPKDTGLSTVISCKDMATNVFPPDHYRCSVFTLFAEDPGLSCLTVQYRIRAGDIPRWRELDATIKAKIRDMLSIRKP